MNLKLTFRHAVGFCAIAMTFTVFAVLHPALAQCDKSSDAQLVADIYTRIKADKGLVGQISHINVVSVSAAIKLEGWADSKSDYDKISNIVMNTSCVRLLNVNAFSDTPPTADSVQRASNGCPPGTKACGDVCIPDTDPCNITGAKAAAAELFTMPRPRELGFLSLSAGCN